MNFINILHNKQLTKKYKVERREREYLEKLNENMIKKSEKRVSDIKTRILNDISVNNFSKKYQIKSFIEYKQLKTFCKTLNIQEYELLWCNSLAKPSDNPDNPNHVLKMNKLEKIIEGDYSCCRDCDKPMKFINRKTNVLYCYFYKNK